jgi:nickel/cobalt exporter
VWNSARRVPSERSWTMNNRLRVWSIGIACALATTLPAAAHPLGNFTINHLTKISAAGDRIDLRYVLDMAEIPTFALMRAHDANGRMTQAQLDAWARDEAAAVSPQLELRLDGVRTGLAVAGARATTRPGAGGLPTLYFVADFHATMPRATRFVAYADRTFEGRLGWKDVVVAPASEPTRELTAYPNALLGSPRSLTAASADRTPQGALRVRDGGATDAPKAPSGSAPSAARSNQLSDMLARGTGNPLFVLLTLLVAVALGALHALEPGHGKTLLAVSLVGARATVRQAAILAGSLTVAHTAGVLLLGVAIILLKGYLIPEAIYPWITLVSGIVIAAIGARAVARQIIARQAFAHAHSHGHAHAHTHDHAHEHHPHEHGEHHQHVHLHGADHTHAHDDEAHARSHAIPGDAPLRFGPTVWAAMSGGVAPCPAALVVLFAAIAQNVVAYGIVVIVFFSFGLATTLTGLGVGVVRGASWLSARPRFERFVRFGPLVSAVVIALIGSVMVGQGFVEQGLPVSAPVITALTALAIAGYAFSHPLAHARSVQAA